MKLIETPLKGAYIVEQTLYSDLRGFFLEIFSAKSFDEKGMHMDFVQDNCSYSKDKGVIRGLHFQNPPHAQAKLIWVLTGSIYDVIVDLREDSPTFLKWEAFMISSLEARMLFILRGFAHGFCTLEPDTRVFYKVDAPYAPKSESGLRWDDPDLSIPWPTDSPILSDKDKILPTLRDLGLKR
ncbi:MAG TPA: dTDP-4-dehydrorhamnose 3,5-epimerase [Desulfomonilia bacterium]|nr:dTDP-4-dehydrorhamnose 3,5-epimerase [Desulfomonilia bacterium]